MKHWFFKLMKLAGKFKILLLLSCLFSFISSILVMFPFIFIYMIIKELLYSNNYEIITHYAKISLIFSLLSLATYLTALLLSHISAFSTINSTKLKLMNHIISLPLGFHIKNPSGKIRKLVEVSSEEIENFVAHNIPDIAYAFVSPIALIILFIYFDYRMAIACLIPIILAFIMQSILMGNKGASRFVAIYQKYLGEMNNSAVEYVRGISVIKTFGQTAFSFKTFYDSIMNYGDYAKKYALSWRVPMSSFVAIVNSSFFFLILFGLIFITKTNDYKSFVLSFIFYTIASALVSLSLMKLMYVNSHSLLVKMAIEDIYKILDEKPLENITKEIKLNDFEISFKNVTFKYDNTNIPAIENISFNALPNTITALVGASGSGKSTIANLIPRFYDINKGSIEIGGVNIKDINYNQLMKTVSFVFQDSKLLKATLFENVKYGNQNASKEEVIKAMELAQCEDIINKFPDGINTKIGTKGVYLSGGEVQRISIARAILKNSPIIVFDEATSFADPENEYQIHLALNKLIKNKTVIMIAHRLSTIKDADLILVLDNGKIIERGNHKELIELNGKYKRMYDNYKNALNWNVKKSL